MSIISRTHLILSILNRVFPNEFQLGQLKQLVNVGNTIKRLTQIFQSLLVADRHQSGKGISLASVVALGI